MLPCPHSVCVPGSRSTAALLRCSVHFSALAVACLVAAPLGPCLFRPSSSLSPFSSLLSSPLSFSSLLSLSLLSSLSSTFHSSLTLFQKKKKKKKRKKKKRERTPTPLLVSPLLLITPGPFSPPVFSSVFGLSPRILFSHSSLGQLVPCVSRQNKRRDSGP